MQKIIKKYWKNGSLSFLLIAATFICLLRLSWLKYGDLIVDVGREMYVPLQILSGKLLYRDFCYIYGPFSPYFNALLFKIFGVSLYSLIICGIITTSAACLLVYKISRFFLNVFFSTFAVLTFLVVLAFGQYLYLGNYNFILPFSYGSIHSIVFALAATYFFYLWLLKEKSSSKYLAGFFITLAILAKIEVGIALLIAVASATLLDNITAEKKLSKRILLHQLCAYILLPVSIAASFYILLWVKGADLSYPVFEMFFLNTNRQFLFPRWLSGIENLSQNLGIIGLAFLYYLALALLFILGGLFLRRLLRFKPGFIRDIFSTLAIFFFILCGLFFVKHYFPFDWQYRPLPVFLLVIIFISIARSLKSKKPQLVKESIMLLFLSIFSLLLLIRMVFFVRAGHYGFYLLAPGMIAYQVFFLKTAPDLFLGAPAQRTFFKTGFFFIFIFFMLAHFNLSKFCYANKTLKITSPRGTLYAFDNSRERNCRRLIQYLIENTDADDTLVVFPEGLPINFLAQRNNPLYYNTYIPADLSKKGATELVLNQLRLYKVDYVVINQRGTLEFGYRAFGIDYAQPIWEYIKEDYMLIKQFGPFPYTTQEFGIALFKRREGS
ncbi:MAG: glycosyltransferase family 39 protein [Candidatus Omnitrophica bacterium]|nr:glycosyltransferase family 39 protein [Candidatus Omnitrophota bacterium]